MKSKRRERLSLHRTGMKILVFLIAFFMVAGTIPYQASAESAKKDGQSESFDDNQYYHVDILVEADYAYTLTFDKDNTESEVADISIVKQWNAIDEESIPESIIVTVKGVTGKGTANEATVSTEQVTLTKAEGWTKDIKGLPLHDEDGNYIEYVVEEEGISVEGQDYYNRIVTEVTSTVETEDDDILVYTKDGKTLTLYYDETAPHINVDGTAYGSTANWTENGDGTYSLVHSYTSTSSSLTYYSTWTYDPSDKTYTYVSDDYMKVTAIDYVTYTDLTGARRILYDGGNYLPAELTTTRDASDNNVVRDYYNYIEQADTNRADQEFWSTNRAIEDMPEGTTIVVGYDYKYGYFDIFGQWHTDTGSTEQTFDTNSSDFENLCGEKDVRSTQRGYDVLLQLSETEVYKGYGLIDAYDVSITNTPVSDLTIQKVVSGDPANADEIAGYKFKIELDSFLGSKITDTFATNLPTAYIPFVDGVAYVTIPAGESITIEGLPVGLGYTVTETAVVLKDGTEQSLEDYITTVNDEVTSSFSGIMMPTEANGSPNAVTFVNEYTENVEYGDVNISKQVLHSLGDNYTIPANKVFNIEVKLTDTEGKAAANQEITIVDNTGTASTVTTDASGQFTYQLIDDQQVILKGLEAGTKVTVAETGVPTGFTATYTPGNTVTAAANTEVSLVVANTYNPAPAEVKLSLTGDKTVTGEGDWDDQEFTFYLQKYAGGQWTTIATDTATSSNPAISFSETETFDAIGTYQYQVIEANHGQTINGVTYDATMHTFVVEVTDADMDGNLEAVVKSSHDTTESHWNKNNAGTWENESIDFNNNVNEGQDSITIMIKKNLKNESGSDRVNLSGFRFELYKDGTLVQTSDATDQSGETFVNQLYTYADLEQDDGSHLDSKEYTYQLKEVNGGVAGVVYDEKVYEFKVVVTAEKVDGAQTGNINAVIEPVEGSSSLGEFTSAAGITYSLANFTNTYDPSDATVTLKVSKNMTGRALNEGEFTFAAYEITFDNSGAPVLKAKPPATAVIDADGTAEITLLDFTKVGTYYYQVKEIAGTAPGVTYDNTAYYVKVVVTDNNGKLAAKTTIINGSALVFNNSYKVEPVTVGFSAMKTIIGKDLKAEAYEFVLDEINADGTSVAGGLHKHVMNDGKGIVDFGEIKYTKAGTYYYKVFEKAGSEGGVTYDTASYIYKVVVEETDQATMAAAVTVSSDGINFVPYTYKGEVPGFKNTYTAAPVKLPVSGTKVLTGKELTAGQFTFNMYQVDAEGTAVEGGQSMTATNDADGNFIFQETGYDDNGNVVITKSLEFDKTGTYYFIIEEAVPAGYEEGVAEDGYVYDTSKYLMTVTVTDNGQGKLVAQPVITLAGEAAADDTGVKIVFNNEYVPDEPGDPEDPGEPGDPGDPPTPDGGTKTGDDSNMGLFLLIALAAMAAAGGAVFRRKHN